MSIPAIRSRLIALIRDPERQRDYRRRGRIAVGNTSHNACAATASQVYLQLGVIHHIECGAEGLATALKATARFDASANRDDVTAGDLVVCEDGNANGLSDHVWLVVALQPGGWFECLDNQGRTLTHRRRVDGADGKTPMRGRLRILT